MRYKLPEFLQDILDDTDIFETAQVEIDTLFKGMCERKSSCDKGFSCIVSLLCIVILV